MTGPVTVQSFSIGTPQFFMILLPGTELGS